MNHNALRKQHLVLSVLAVVGALAFATSAIGFVQMFVK
jgi:hypothetical protein